MKKTVLITGARGFLGSSLKQYISRSHPGYTVYGISRSLLSRGRDIFAVDFTQKAPLKAILRRLKPVYIFHFSGGRFSDEQETFNANFISTKVLMETVRDEGMGFRPRVIIPGSAAEYGKIKGRALITEDCLPKPLGWYGFVKLLQTDLGLFYARQGLDVVVARMFNICGAGTPSQLALGGFARQIVAIERGAEPVLKTKNLDGRRDFLDIEDVCRGLWMIAHRGKAGELYNLCSSRPVTMRQLLKAMLKFARLKGIRVEENRQDASPSFDMIGSNTKLRSAILWSPRVDLLHSLSNTLDSYRGQVPV